MAISTPAHEKMTELRQRIASGQEYTEEELCESIRLLHREVTVKASSSKVGKTPKVSINLDDLFADPPKG